MNVNCFHHSVLIKLALSTFCLSTNDSDVTTIHAQIQRGIGGPEPLPLEYQKKTIEFLSNTGPDFPG